jgi:hypothetical protein
MHRAPFSKIFIGTNPPCHIVLGVLTARVPTRLPIFQAHAILFTVIGTSVTQMLLAPRDSIDLTLDAGCTTVGFSPTATLLVSLNVELTSAARLYRAASSDRRERGCAPG